MHDEGSRLGAADRALLTALVAGSLRWHHRLDWQLNELVLRPLAARDAELAALIRIGLFQLQWLRIPDHAAVAATVETAPALGKGHAKSLINAVLRRFLREREALEARMRDVPVARLSHPAWLIDAIAADWPRAAERIFEANNTQAPMWLRVNPRRGSRGSYLRELASAGIAGTAATDLPHAILLAEPVPVAELPGFGEGRVSVQDGAAQYAALLLDTRPGQRVLDACAAPGGKTAHVLESCPGIAELLAIDIDAERLATVAENLARLGLVATLFAADAAEPATWWDGRPFERILLDAPCTATGVIRRHPDIKVLRRPADVDRAAVLQSHLLRALWPLLAAGGRLVYVTCSILERENAAQVEEFVGATRGACVALPENPFAGQSLPGEANRDGFYYACIDRRDGR